MGYDINAFVAEKGVFTEFRQLSPYITVAPLNQGFELILDDEYLENSLELEASSIPEEHKDLSLSQSMLDWISLLSRRVPIAYINAYFFGGNGSQSAALWRHGAMILKPAMNGVMIGEAYEYTNVSERPINSVLRELGVKAIPPEDEFAALGLQKHRHNDDWFEAHTGFSKREYEPYVQGNGST